ncbi:hypothetical protein D3C83_49050 [compost metagenome]
MRSHTSAGGGGSGAACGAGAGAGASTTRGAGGGAGATASVCPAESASIGTWAQPAMSASTPAAIARLLKGIGSFRLPASAFYRTPAW